ncbi:G patch domain-containing protein 3-like [Ptychodera flava]|uniref:G patch domain-containing protein 3-like n=1 Tax=Ptychodera flava TaxID=63121 RepID=UPI00396A0B00
MAASSEGSSTSSVYGIVGNIPPNFHSADLRNYFSQFVEARGFECFHFKHRPEVKSKHAEENLQSSTLTVDSSDSNSSQTRPESPRKKQKTLCCIVRLSESKMEQFMKMYNRNFWVGRDGSSMSSRCAISRIKFGQNVTEIQNKRYQTREEVQQIPTNREKFTETDLRGLPELSPPAVMPNGNVGTPTSFFLKLIRTCRMPPSLIKKLGLVFPKSRSMRRYGNVPFDYGGRLHFEGEEGGVNCSEEDLPVSFDSQERSDVSDGVSDESQVENDNQTKTSNISCTGRTWGSGKMKKQSMLWSKKSEKMYSTRISESKKTESDDDDDDDDDGDNDTCEDWERHEALHDDVTEQGRTKERLYEEEIELKWEKGGSGLVFYTDANYWDEQEGDFDERTADDWDVDMSIYYEPDGGDKDARDLMEMRLHQFRRGEGEDSRNFDKIGQFESYTKGIGRKVLEKQGWTDGEGLGSSVKGQAEALTNEGQNPRQRTGLGYYGEKLNRNVKKRKTERGIITTVYDKPDEPGPGEPLYRSQNPWTLKYRPEIQFLKANTDDEQNESGPSSSVL